MIYEGYFENRDRDIITVRIKTKDSTPIVIGVNDLKNIPPNIEGSVKTNTTFRILKGVFIEYTKEGNFLAKLRLYKGVPIQLTRRTGVGNYSYCVRNLAGKVITTESDITAPLNYTPETDGFLMVSFDGTAIYQYIIKSPDVISELLFTEDPITINRNSDGIYSALKLQSATVRIMANEFLTNLYAADVQDTYVEIENNTKAMLLFKGYLTPNIYTQSYTYVRDELELEFVSSISTLSSFKYREPQDGPLVTWFDVLQEILHTTGCYEEFYIHNVMAYQSIQEWLKEVKINYKAFKEKDKDTYIDLKKILENFCTTFSLSLVEHFDRIYFIDYNQIIDDEVEFIHYKFGENKEYIVSGDYIVVGNDLQYASTEQTIELDDMYGEFVLKQEIVPLNDKIVTLDEENDLICLHPNIPYLTVTSQDSTLYKDTNFEYVDLYRVYLTRTFKHMSYQSKYAVSPSYNYGFYAGHEMTLSTFSSWYTTTDEATWMSNFMTYLRQHLCCFVVKHFQYKYDPRDNYNNKEPNSLKWSTEYLVSYGMNGRGLGTFSDEYVPACGLNIYRHNTAARDLPILVTKDLVNLIPGTDYQAYLQCEGSVYFSASQYLNTECDKVNESLPKEDKDVYNTSGYTMETLNYNVSFGGCSGVFSYVSHNNYKVDSLGVRNIGIYPNRDRDKMYAAVKDLAFKWHNMWDTNRSFKENVLDIKGNITPYTTGYFDYMSIYPPTPYINSNNIQINFAFMKDIKISTNRSWPIEIVMSGKQPDNKIESTTETSYNNTEKLTVEIPYISRRDDRVLGVNTLFRSDGVPLDDMDYEYWQGRHDTVEGYAIAKMRKRYEVPRLIFNADYEFKYDYMRPYYIFEHHGLNKNMFMDSFEYNVLHSTINIKLVEFV